MFHIKNRSDTNDQGSALIAVLGVMAVTMVIGVTVAAASISSLGFTSSTRAGIQSVAAAESGVNVAEVALRSGTCAATYTRTTVPAYTAKLWYSLSATNDAWITGCPPAVANAQRVKVVSTGDAATDGVAGNVGSNESVVEAIYPVVRLPGIFASGAAMYVHGGVVFNNNGDLFVSESGRPAIQVRNGDMKCENNTVIQGDVVVQTGNLDITACKIEGNAWASGSASLGTVTGNLTASNATRPPGVGGIYTRNGPIPAVPAWVDFDYTPAEWVDALGIPFEVRTATGTGCTLPSTLGGTIPGKPLIYNALGCAGGVKANHGTITLTSDVVIFSNTFDFGNVSQVIFKSSSTTVKRNLWFVTPDNTVDSLPTCASGQGNFIMKNGFDITDSVNAMLYTPCRFAAVNNFEWRGQLYANGANDFKNNTEFTYVPMGLPGIDLDTGLPPVGGSIGGTGELGALTSIRDLANAP